MAEDRTGGAVEGRLRWRRDLLHGNVYHRMHEGSMSIGFDCHRIDMHNVCVYLPGYYYACTILEKWLLCCTNQ